MQTTFLCLASFFKGAAFLDECQKLGVDVVLVTQQDLYDKPWPANVEKFCVPDLTDEATLLKAVCYLARSRKIDAIVPLDEYCVDTAASFREFLRVPGTGVTTSRYHRDKLSMRLKAREAGLPIPDFCHVLHHPTLAEFLERTEGPWILKPRAEAGAVKMKKIQHPPDLWEALTELGDDQSKYLVECFVPGNVLHVDSVVWDGKVLFSAPHQYWTPPFNIWHGGGVFGSVSIPSGDPVHARVMELNKQVIKAMNVTRGVTHVEFIVAHETGEIYFLELANRVGGAHIDALVRGTTGLDLWREWARVEAAAARKQTYKLPKAQSLVGGLLVCLTRQEEPDLDQFDDAEVVWRYSQDYHAGLVLASRSPERIRQLMQGYLPRIEEDFLAVAPPIDRPA